MAIARRAANSKQTPFNASSVEVQYDNPTLAGSTLLTVVICNPGGGADSADVDLPAGWVPISGSPWRRLQSVVVAAFLKENAASESAPYTASITNAVSGAPMSTRGIVFQEEITGGVTADIVDKIIDDALSNLAPDTGSSAATEQADELVLAFIAHANVASSLSGNQAGFTDVAQVPSGGTGTTTINARLSEKLLSATGTFRETGVISGATSRAWVAVAISFKELGTTPTGKPTLPAQTGGKLARALSLQLRTANLPPTLSQAQILARDYLIITGQVEKLGARPPDMLAANPDCLLMPYEKGNFWTGTPTDFPNAWYMHTAAGAKIQNSYGFWLMQPEVVTAPHTFQGVTATCWRDWQAKRCVKRVDDENAKYSTLPWRGSWRDTLGPFGFVGNPVDPVTGITYNVWGTKDAQNVQHPGFLALVWTNGDAARDLDNNPLPIIVWANAARPKDSRTWAVDQHFDGVMSEGWLFANGTTFDTWPSAADYANSMRLALSIQANGVYVQTLDYFTHWTYDKNSDGTARGDAADRYSRKRFFVFGSQLIFQRGKLFSEVVVGTSNMDGSNPRPSTDPWDETSADPALYGVVLGDPIDTAASYEGALVSGQPNLHARRFERGIVLVNSDTADRFYLADRGYQNLPNTQGWTQNQTIRVSARTALVLVTPVDVPVNINPAFLTGGTELGDTLTCNGAQTAADWTNSPTSITLQWQRVDLNGNNPVDISGATNPTYDSQAADEDSRLQCRVRAANAAGSNDVTTIPSAVITAPSVSVPANSSLPVIDNLAPQVGDILNVTTGEWTNDPTGYTFQWKRGGVNIAGATDPSYTVVVADLAAVLTCSVLAANAAGPAAAAATSAGTAAVTQPAPANIVLPSITGDELRVGVEQTASEGSWAGSGITFEYQWNRDGAPIAGATLKNYTPVALDDDTLLSVDVLATNGGGGPITATSEEVGPIAPAVDPEVAALLTVTSPAGAVEIVRGQAGTWFIVTGRSVHDSGIRSVTVNGARVKRNRATGRWTHRIRLRAGANTVRVVARAYDRSKATVTRTVTLIRPLGVDPVSLDFAELVVRNRDRGL